MSNLFLPEKESWERRKWKAQNNGDDLSMMRQKWERKVNQTWMTTTAMTTSLCVGREGDDGAVD